MAKINNQKIEFTNKQFIGLIDLLEDIDYNLKLERPEPTLEARVRERIDAFKKKYKEASFTKKE